MTKKKTKKKKKKRGEITCMLLYLLKVLLQTEQENWVGPTRIWAGVGIQYCPSTGRAAETSLDSVAAAVAGGPICIATVTAAC